MSTWGILFRNCLERADLDALMVHSLYEIKERDHRLEVLIHHLTIVDEATWRALTVKLQDWSKSQRDWIKSHQENELNAWGRNFEARMEYFQTRERFGAKDPQWVSEYESRKSALQFLEWVGEASEAAWEVISRRKGEHWRNRTPSEGELSNTAVQGIYKCGKRMYVDNEFSQALEQFLKGAEYGHPASQNALGVMYGKGHGCVCDYTKAVQWFQRAADQEELRALYNLYSMYSSGWYTSGTGGEDRALALRYLQAAAVRGFAQAQCKLGVLYRVGRELPQDYAEAAKWYRRGADQGYAYSMHNLAEIYEKGLGVREDAREAAMWDGMFHQYKGLDVEYFLL